MPHPKLTRQQIDMWVKTPYVNTELCPMMCLIDCLALLWDIFSDDAYRIIDGHQGALAQATAQQHTVFQTAFTLGRLDLESPDSVILATLGTSPGGNDDE